MTGVDHLPLVGLILVFVTHAVMVGMWGGKLNANLTLMQKQFKAHQEEMAQQFHEHRQEWRQEVALLREIVGRLEGDVNGLKLSTAVEKEVRRELSRIRTPHMEDDR